MNRRIYRGSVLIALAAALTVIAAATARMQQASPLPAGKLAFGGFIGEFAADGTFAIAGQGWPKLAGSWKATGSRVELALTNPPNGCGEPGQYEFRIAGTRVTFTLVADSCSTRRMILDRSTWRPAGEPEPVPVRRLERVAAPALPALPAAAPGRGSWPSFRGSRAAGVADGQSLPDRWDVKSGENVIWRTAVPGLAHSSPIVWGDRIFVTTAISGQGSATFKPGLYGDGDASEDRSTHRWVIYAIDKKSGKVAWERVAHEGPPRNKRHIKSTYASATPATDGRIVVAWFGSEGVHAYDVQGNFRWKVDLGRVDMGAYDIPTFEWGPASSPIIWNDLVIIQCDTQADSFLIALDAATGKTVWKTDRDELPSWGTPTVIDTPGGPELVTNASNFVRGYDPRTRQGAVAARPELEDHGAHAHRGRRPLHHRERPRAGASDFRRAPGRARRRHAGRNRDDERRSCLEHDRARLVHADAARLQRHPLRAREQRRLRCVSSGHR